MRLTGDDGFREFAPTITDKVEPDGEGLHGTKTAEILLMPERGGRLEIPSIDMTIFDPDEKRYRKFKFIVFLGVVLLLLIVTGVIVGVVYLLKWLV